MSSRELSSQEIPPKPHHLQRTLLFHPINTQVRYFAFTTNGSQPILALSAVDLRTQQMFILVSKSD
jgi:hypothetical protein